MNSQPVEIPKKWGLRGAFSLSRLVPALAVIGFSWFCLYYRGVGHVPLFGHNATESVVPLSGGTRERPIAIAPHGDLRAEVSDDHLRVVLSAAVPYWDPIRTPAALHAVRLWGVDFEFPVGRQGTRIPRGRDYLAVLLDEHAFRCENRDAIGDTVDTADSFLFATRFGIGVSVNERADGKAPVGGRARRPIA